MSRSTKLNLAPLKISEATTAGDISLKDVAENGATAVIPKPPLEDDEDAIQFFVGANKTDWRKLGDIADRVYTFLLPKAWLLDSAGSPEPLEFKYVIAFAGANETYSEPISYLIRH
jgi:hypothetical protein